MKIYLLRNTLTVLLLSDLYVVIIDVSIQNIHKNGAF